MFPNYTNPPIFLNTIPRVLSLSVPRSHTNTQSWSSFSIQLPTISLLWVHIIRLLWMEFAILWRQQEQLQIQSTIMTCQHLKINIEYQITLVSINYFWSNTRTCTISQSPNLWMLPNCIFTLINFLHVCTTLINTINLADLLLWLQWSGKNLSHIGSFLFLVHDESIVYSFFLVPEIYCSIV